MELRDFLSLNLQRRRSLLRGDIFVGRRFRSPTTNIGPAMLFRLEKEAKRSGDDERLAQIKHEREIFEATLKDRYDGMIDSFSPGVRSRNHCVTPLNIDL